MADESVHPINDLALSLLLERLSSQDKVQDRILAEVKRTNGSVIDLRQRVGVLEAVEAEARLSALELTRKVDAGKTAVLEHDRDQRRDRRRFIVQGAYVIFGGLVGAVGHALHVW